MLKLFLSVSAIALSIGFLVAGLLHTIPEQQTAQATGCPTQFVTEHIDNALKAFDEKNAEELKNQLDLAKEALGIAASENE